MCSERAGKNLSFFRFWCPSATSHGPRDSAPWAGPRKSCPWPSRRASSRRKKNLIKPEPEGYERFRTRFWDVLRLAQVLAQEPASERRTGVNRRRPPGCGNGINCFMLFSSDNNNKLHPLLLQINLFFSTPSLSVRLIIISFPNAIFQV